MGYDIIVTRVTAYRLQLVSCHRLDGLDDARDIRGLSRLDEARTSKQQAGVAGLAGLECVELGPSNSLGQVLLANGTLGNAPEGLDSFLGRLADVGGGAGELDSEEAGVRVALVVGGNGETGARANGLGEEAEAR